MRWNAANGERFAPGDTISYTRDDGSTAVGIAASEEEVKAAHPTISNFKFVWAYWNGASVPRHCGGNPVTIVSRNSGLRCAECDKEVRDEVYYLCAVCSGQSTS